MAKDPLALDEFIPHWVFGLLVNKHSTIPLG